jgi:tetratricopeptide (TPR) repeat protein
MQHDPALVELFTDALSRQARGDAPGALLAYRRLQRRFPDFPDAWTNASVLLAGMGRFEEALASAERGAGLDGGNPAAAYALAAARMGLGQFGEAEPCLRRVIEIAPDHVPALTNLAAVRAMTGDLAEALELHDRAVALSPSSSAIVGRRGHAKVQALDMEGAEKDLARALELDPGNEDARLDLAHVWLRTLRYGEAWRHFKARRHLTAAAVEAQGHGRPFWRGGAIGGATLLVYSERGAGDTIQFARLLPMAKEASGARVLLAVHGPLARLMAGVPGADGILLQAGVPGTDGFLLQGGAPPAFDYVAPITELPPILEIDPSRLPPPTRLTAPADPSAPPIPGLDSPRFKVGLVWAGSPLHANDAARSMDPRLLGGLADLPGAESISWLGLQKPPSAEPPPLPGFTDLSGYMGDYADTARIAARMDLIVTVDTSTAHLAGSLGVPTIVLLPHFPEWRWGLGGTTPWYPAARLIRQPSPGDWRGAVEKLKTEIVSRIVASGCR